MVGAQAVIAAVLAVILTWAPPARGAEAGERAVSEARPAFDWDLYHGRQDACREADRIAQDCTKGVAFCDELALRQARRACSAFGPLYWPPHG
jgi:hypothetical protein